MDPAGISDIASEIDIWDEQLKKSLDVLTSIQDKKSFEDDFFDVTLGHNAFLGPQLWDKKINCCSDLSLQLMDLNDLLAGSTAENSLEIPSELTTVDSSDIVIKNDVINTDRKDTDELSVDSVDFNIDPEDLVLASEPGNKFDPKSTKFTKSELKPQAIVKKSRKRVIPDKMKDDRYWSKRQKNNVAAKRSREARRVKENQIILRASFLETENTALKTKLEKVKTENEELKERLLCCTCGSQMTNIL